MKYWPYFACLGRSDLWIVQAVEGFSISTVCTGQCINFPVALKLATTVEGCIKLLYHVLACFTCMSEMCQVMYGRNFLWKLGEVCGGCIMHVRAYINARTYTYKALSVILEQ